MSVAAPSVRSYRSTVSRADDGNSLRNISKTMSKERREKLIGLRDRERMKGVLLEKFERRYGADRAKRDHDLQSVADSILQKEVNHFVETAVLTEDNLNRLERRMHNHAKKPGQCASNVSTYSRLTRSGTAPSIAPSNYSRSSIKTSEGTGERYNWSMLDKAAQMLAMKETAQERMVHLSKQRQMKDDLDKQIMESKMLREQEREKDKAFNDQQKKELMQWMEDEEDRQQKKREKASKERETRDLQLRYERQVKEEENERKAKDEKLLVAKIATELISEKKNQARKKEQQREVWQEMHAVNEHEKLQKKEAAEREREQDICFMNEYAARMENDEIKKASELKKRLDAQEARRKALESLQGGMVDRVGDLGKSQGASEFRSGEDEKRRAEIKFQMQVDTKNEQLARIRQNEQAKEDAKVVKQRQFAALARDNETFAKLKEEEEKKKKLRHAQHAKELEHQIQGRRAEKEELMSADEVAMSRDLLLMADKMKGGPFG